ncbi:hypothetical protein SFCCH060_3974 [Shigella flexneri CCH060]|uniref:Uncharacterized protein n=1 Tax=Shigella flexneri CCH060 TaxID=754091 RepID=A0A6N3QTX1_SHIFL|nr:hypothetical protein SFCCH060_4877 [Shigella flexneri CCH060]EIQ06380.1 hypothetical protein SFCCH060_3974 [Shigella flexneri CCH060]
MLIASRLSSLRLFPHLLLRFSEMTGHSRLDPVFRHFW